jgi:hypothetical protein
LHSEAKDLPENQSGQLGNRGVGFCRIDLELLESALERGGVELAIAVQLGQGGQRDVVGRLVLGLGRDGRA